MKKITLVKSAKDITSSVVLYAYTREGGYSCYPSNIGCGLDNGCHNSSSCTINVNNCTK